MPSTTEITVQQLSRLVGLPGAPVIVDVRLDEDYDADPRSLPASHRRNFQTVSTWAAD
ncbi:sulfurtransferase, partial [Mesorhizobium sp. M2D.F.Ca.ET.145.01.1.1]